MAVKAHLILGSRPRRLRPLRNDLAPNLLAEENVFTWEIVFTHAELTTSHPTKRFAALLAPSVVKQYVRSPTSCSFIVRKRLKRRLISSLCVLVAAQPPASSTDFRPQGHAPHNVGRGITKAWRPSDREHGSFPANGKCFLCLRSSCRQRLCNRRSHAHAAKHISLCNLGQPSRLRRVRVPRLVGDVLTKVLAPKDLTRRLDLVSEGEAETWRMPRVCWPLRVIAICHQTMIYRLTK